MSSTPSKFGSPGVPMYGYKLKLLHESTGEELTGPNEKGVSWKARRRLASCKLCGKTMRASSTPTGKACPASWSTAPLTGAFEMKTGIIILGRTDDVINVAGHRLGTREIEESISGHAGVAEVAVVGVADQPQRAGRHGLCGAQRLGCAA